MKYLPFLSLLLLGLPLVVFGQADPGFVPLTTNAPFLDNVGNADSLSAFLNDIYKVCIGIAATLAVLQIMRAGIMYMGGDSVTEKKEAKNLIAMSIGGLILVLSPVVVFSIINPEILSLEIKDLSKLASTVTDWEPGSFDPDGEGTGTGGTGGGVNPIEFRASVFSKYEGESLAEANLYKTLCNSAAIPTNARHIIKTLVPKGPEARLDESGPTVRTIYSLYCESESTSFFRYTLAVRTTPGERKGAISAQGAERYAPGFEQYATAYENSCKAEGGKFVRDPDWFWTGYDNCSAEIEKSIFDSLASSNVTSNTHSVNCQQVEFYCRKP